MAPRVSSGKATRELSVRAKSTKYNPGSLPISAYGSRVPTANPSPCLVELRNSLASQGLSSSESDSEDTTEDCGSIIPEFIGKGSTVLMSHDQRASGMFLLGVLARDWRPKKNSTLSDEAKVHIYSPGPGCSNVG